MREDKGCNKDAFTNVLTRMRRHRLPRLNLAMGSLARNSPSWALKNWPDSWVGPM
jgi:hypothetical protein